MSDLSTRSSTLIVKSSQGVTKEIEIDEPDVYDWPQSRQ